MRALVIGQDGRGAVVTITDAIYQPRLFACTTVTDGISEVTHIEEHGRITTQDGAQYDVTYEAYLVWLMGRS